MTPDKLILDEAYIGKTDQMSSADETKTRSTLNALKTGRKFRAISGNN